jgi:hypothetical protein
LVERFNALLADFAARAKQTGGGATRSLGDDAGRDAGIAGLATCSTRGLLRYMLEMLPLTYI